ncbi:hypothetical protein JCM37173_02100 [Allocoprococcus similis]
MLVTDTVNSNYENLPDAEKPARCRKTCLTGSGAYGTLGKYEKPMFGRWILQPLLNIRQLTVYLGGSDK